MLGYKPYVDEINDLFHFSVSLKKPIKKNYNFYKCQN